MRAVIAILVVAGLLFGVSMGVFAEEQKRQTIEQVDRDCVAHLLEIFRLLKLYEHHTGGAVAFPKELETLSPMTRDPMLFICPSDKGWRTAAYQKESSFQSSYEIPEGAVDLLAKKSEASLVAVVVEKRKSHNGRRHVLFYDGTVRLMDDREFNELKKNGFMRVAGEAGVRGGAKTDRKGSKRDAVEQIRD